MRHNLTIPIPAGILRSGPNCRFFGQLGRELKDRCEKTYRRTKIAAALGSAAATKTDYNLLLPMRFPAAAWIILGLLVSGCAPSTASFLPRSGVVAADSSAEHRALLEVAWADQVAFEKFRIQTLPRLWGPFTEKPACRSLVGRFCVAEGNAAGAWKYMSEDPQIAIKRLSLVDALRAVARRIPGDDWVAGQLVRYSIEAGLIEEARGAAIECAGTAWWCAALGGYVLHRTGETAAALTAFEIALSRMPMSERLRWTDPTVLLDAVSAESLGAMPASRRIEFVDRFWAMADPFFSMPGNEVFSEHLARRVEIQFQYAAGFLEGQPWGSDLDELTMRYGLPDSRIRGMGARFPYPVGMTTRLFYIAPPFGVADLISHYTMASRDLLPPIAEGRIGVGAWDRTLRWPRAGYSLSVEGAPIEWLSEVEYQTAKFRRGNRFAVVGALELTGVDALSGLAMDVGMALAPIEEGEMMIDSIAVRGASSVVPLVRFAEPGEYLLSLEAIAPQSGLAVRVRRILELPAFSSGDMGLSDILLVDGTALPDSLVDALATSRGSNRVRPGEQVGLFWEAYGVDSSVNPQVSMSLTVREGDVGVLRRLGRIFGLGPSGGGGGTVRWQEETSPGPRMARSISFEVPDLPRGRHTIELTMEVSGREPVTASKEVLVGSPDVPTFRTAEVTRRPMLARTLCATVLESLVGNEGNLQAFAELREFEAFQDLVADSWRYPLPDVPQSMSCFDWVRTRDEYFGYGAEAW